MNVSGMEREIQPGVRLQTGHYNGDLDEDEAFELALKESRKFVREARRPVAPGAQHRDMQQDSPLGHPYIGQSTVGAAITMRSTSVPI